MVLAWAQGRPDDAAIHVAVRPSGGTFGPPIRVAATHELFPSVAAGPGTILVVWQDLEAIILPAA